MGKATQISNFKYDKMSLFSSLSIEQEAQAFGVIKVSVFNVVNASRKKKSEYDERSLFSTLSMLKET